MRPLGYRGRSEDVRPITSKLVPIRAYEANLKRKVRRHFKALGFTRAPSGILVPKSSDKEAYRTVHGQQRQERLAKVESLMRDTLPEFLRQVADGREVRPADIAPRLELITAGTAAADIFRIATMTWSIPVSDGFGRRLKFIVRDDSNGKLIGLMALGDPVFNLGARDRLIGWSSTDRESRLVNVLDAFILGALPPYSALLGGKLVACLVKTREVEKAFRARYGNARGVISKTHKAARLALVTTTSAMGRSSIYNRLKIGNRRFFEPIGFTEGYGHFHLPDELFADLRTYLRRTRDPYATNNRYGQGPNWKMRVVRKAFASLGLGPKLLHHGFKREIFSCQLATNTLEYLRGAHKRPNFRDLMSVEQVSELCIERWMLPRALSRPDFCDFRPEYLRGVIATGSAWQTPRADVGVLGNQSHD